MLMVLEELKVLIQLKFGPAEGPVSLDMSVIQAREILLSGGEGWVWLLKQIHVRLVVVKFAPVAGWVLVQFSAIGMLVSAIGGTLKPPSKVPRLLGECGINF